MDKVNQGADTSLDREARGMGQAESRGAKIFDEGDVGEGFGIAEAANRRGVAVDRPSADSTVSTAHEDILAGERRRLRVAPGRASGGPGLTADDSGSNGPEQVWVLGNAEG
jgi:hypothetical protein